MLKFFYFFLSLHAVHGHPQNFVHGFHKKNIQKKLNEQKKWTYRLGCTLLFSVRNIFLPIYSNFSIPAVFLSIPVIAAVICSQ